MSGHSKWATTKRRKFAVDAKRSSAFTKLANAITIAARTKGGDPEMNFSLRLAIDSARAASMPKENIDRAIKRGTGELEGVQIEEIVYEGYGPGGVALLIACMTDNRNRTVSEVKHLLSKHGGSFGAVGSVMWMFEKKGVLYMDSSQFTPDLELLCIEAGAHDILQEDGSVTIVTSPEELASLQHAVLDSGATLEGAEITYLPKNTTAADGKTQESIETLMEILEDLDDVDRVYSNLA